MKCIERHLSTLVAVAAAATLAGCSAVTDEAARAVAPTRAPTLRVPTGFVVNAGQWRPGVLVSARTASGELWLERGAVALACPAPGRTFEVFRLEVVDALPTCELLPADRLPHRVSFLKGADPAGWRRGLEVFGRAALREVRPGIDLGVQLVDGHPEYHFVLAPGASLADLKLRCSGQRRLEARPGGMLALVGEHGELVQQPPRAFRRDGSGRQVEVDVRVEPRGDGRFGFAVDGERGTELLIDPVLQWASYVGGSAFEWGYGAAASPDGSVVVVGESTSSDFPTTAGSYDPSFNGGIGPPRSDVYVARFDGSGQIVYATWLGGSDAERPFGVAVDALGSAVVVGSTSSSGFPTTPGAFATSLSGTSDGFAARLSADGSTLLFSTLLGGAGAETAEAAALAPNGDVVVAGVTSSASFPTTAGAFQSLRAGSSDAFVVHLDSTGARVAATLIGGADGDVANGVAVAPDGSVWVGGVTSSRDFPTTPGAPQASLSGNGDAFATRFSSDLTAVLGSTLYGGSSGESGESIDVDADGNAYLTGVTSSNDCPVTAGAYQSVRSGSSDGFVVSFAPSMTLRFATLCGGSSGDVPKGVRVFADGSLVIGGQTTSSNYPATPDAVQAAGAGSSDGFVTHLSADGSGLLYSTMVGGGGADGGEAIGAVDPAAVTLTGVTGSGNFPVTPGAWSTQQLGTNDAFAAQLDVRPQGLSTLGTATANCGRASRIGASRRPDAGAVDFALIDTGAPANLIGLVGLSTAAAPGLPALGVAVFVDPTSLLATLTVVSDGNGFARMPLPLGGAAPGTSLVAQFFWLNLPACGSPFLLSSSAGLQVTVQ